jgi:hypothetical protein
MLSNWRIILRSALTGLFLSLVIILRSQEMWGISTSNFAGSIGMRLNPSSIVTSKLYMDINIVTADGFFDNNYAYIHASDYSPTMFLHKNPQLPEYGPDNMAFDHFTTTSNKHAYASELVMGPSAMVAYGSSAFGIYTGVRVLSSLYRIPYHILNFGYYGLDYTPQQNIDYNNDNFSSVSIAMGEVGVTYAYAFRQFSNSDWSVGVTAKYLFSMGGAYMKVNNLDYMVVNDTTIDVKNLNAEVGYSIPLNYDNNDFPDGSGWIKGSGFGADIGVTYQHKILSYQKKRISKLCRQRYIDYTFKVSASIIDLGFVNFTKNAQVHAYDNVSEYWIGVDTLNYYNVNQLAGTFSEVFYGDPTASYRGNKTKVFLPTAFTLQGDYKIYKNFYAGAVFMYPLAMGKSFIHRPPQIALVPRYETPTLEFALPMSLYYWQYPKLGASARYHFLTIGTDDLLSLLGLVNFTGVDFYISLKINFRKGNCGWFNRFVPCENDEYGIRHTRR